MGRFEIKLFIAGIMVVLGTWFWQSYGAAGPESLTLTQVQQNPVSYVTLKDFKALDKWHVSIPESDGATTDEYYPLGQPGQDDMTGSAAHQIFVGRRVPVSEAPGSLQLPPEITGTLRPANPHELDELSKSLKSRGAPIESLEGAQILVRRGDPNDMTVTIWYGIGILLILAATGRYWARGYPRFR